jgi:glyoxylase-like metal-dependent hydrolase (beta-lactamase superfamily II)
MKLLFAALIVAGCGVSALAQEAKVSVDKLAEQVYLFTHNNHRSLFVVSQGGVLATDPQSPDAAVRYLQEIRKITQAPIRYIVYSHHHADHASGAARLSDTAVIVSHANLPKYLTTSGAGIVPPHVTFTESAAIQLDNLEVRLIYPGPSETDNSIILHIPARRLAFMVDAIFVRAVPWRDMAGSTPDAWIAALKRLMSLEFDTLALGHGPVGTKQDVQAFIDYINVLRDAVAARIKQGQSLEQIQSSLQLPQYATWERYKDHLTLNIAGMYRELTKK